MIAPYGSERSYNGLRLAGTLSKAEGEEVKLFLIGDAASCAKAGQKVPEGFLQHPAHARSRCAQWCPSRGLRHVHGCTGITEAEWWKEPT